MSCDILITVLPSGFMPRVYIGSLRELNHNDNVEIYGWLQDLKLLKNVSFLIMRDRTGTVQVTFKNTPDIVNLLKELPRESVLKISGKINKKSVSKSGLEVSGESVEVLNRSERPLPLPVIDPVQADLETRLNNRFIDLRKRDVSSIFNAESSILWGIREFLHSQGFIEVHTPKIVAAATEGGADLFPVKYFENDAYLNQSPQLYKEILMSSGFEKVFEVGPAFRAEEHNTTRHLNEFTSIDIEMSFADHNDAMRILENAVKSGIENMINENGKDLQENGINISIPEIPFPRITYKECIKLLEKEGLEFQFGNDFSPEELRIIGRNFKDFYFITEWPSSLRPFYTMPNRDDPTITNSFDLQYREVEVTSGAQRVHDPDLLLKRFNEKKLNIDSFKFYIQAFKYGMPHMLAGGSALKDSP